MRRFSALVRAGQDRERGGEPEGVSRGELSIVCLPVFSQSFLPVLLQPFLARYPEVSLTIVPQESPLLEEWLSAQRHDLGLTETLVTPAERNARSCSRWMRSACCLPATRLLSKQF